jgi:glycosyltransferase 2 family protein
MAAAAWLVFHLSKTSEWSSFRSERFWRSLAGVQVSSLVVAIAYIYCSYFFRSLRWREFLVPIKQASLWNIFSATLVGFSAVALLGRPGEVVRPFLIARREQVGVSSQFGAWTLERIFDTITMGMLIGIVLVISPPHADTRAAGTAADVVRHLKVAGAAFCVGGILVSIFLARLRQWLPILHAAAHWSARLLPLRYREPFQRGLTGVLDNFAGGLSSVASLRQFAKCTALSICVWIPVILAYRATMYAFGPPMTGLTMGAIVLLLAVMAAGSMIQLPAVGGTPQVAVILVLTRLFGIPLEIASTAAILLWVISFLTVLIVGVPLAAREGLNWQRLRSMTSADTSAGWNDPNGSAIAPNHP